ncbi:hypothetical protein [Nostoc sp. LEGE 12450]|uniref:hypothetical protein n=1 Tax=Nostoc sp. LEGE 12450 TaxID=1828643 RepID=UPI00187E439F|nr:hypothetical protein [Nostoc sp. LEGE 12450]MBE8989071.1 hypothetical protein [Nostoc sp. LEGE 12450]
MPLVFVHGVNVRQGVSYDKEINHRNALFQKFLLKEIVQNPDNVIIFNPYWGDYGVKFAWEKKSLTQSAIEELGSEDELPLILINQIQLEQELNPDTVLLEVAKKSLADVIDLLWAVSASGVNKSQAEDLADLAVRAVNYAKYNPHPDWLNNIENDQQFLRDLPEEINKWESHTVYNTEDSPQWEVFGSNENWNPIRKGASRFRSNVMSWAGKPVTNKIRNILKGEIANFMGDVFVYLSKRGVEDKPGDIVKEIVDTLLEAKNLINIEDDKLIVVAHSMGGNIIYDILTHFRPDIEVDVLVTVGSQVALFEEMKLFHVSDETVTANSEVNRVSKPANVHRWINVFDFNDFLGFATESVFEGVKDFEYRTGNVLVAAHNTYFNLPIFHERLAEKIRDLNS